MGGERDGDGPGADHLPSFEAVAAGVSCASARARLAARARARLAARASGLMRARARSQVMESAGLVLGELAILTGSEESEVPQKN